jgi:hypothetical protein
LHGAPLESGADKKTNTMTKPLIGNDDGGRAPCPPMRNDSEAGGLCAFDYEKQSWVTDQGEARALRLRQINDELALLNGARGEEFARFTRSTRTEAIAELELQRRAIITGGKEMSR